MERIGKKDLRNMKKGTEFTLVTLAFRANVDLDSTGAK